MNADQAASKGTVVALVSLIGGAVAAVSGLFPWLKVSSGIIAIPGGAVPAEAKVPDFQLAVIALALAGLCVFSSLLWLALVRLLPLVAAVLILAGGAIAGVAIYALLDPAARFVDFAADTAATRKTPTADLQSLLPRFFAANDVRVSAGLGLYLALGGGILILLTGLFALVRSRQRITKGAAQVVVSTESEEGVSAPSSRSDEVKQGEAVDAPSELDLIAEAPEEQPRSPVREIAEPAADVVEGPPATPEESGPPPAETPTSSEDQQEPRPQGQRDTNEWNF
jgi:hypothetical protein